MRHRVWVSALVAPLLVVACNENPVGLEDEHDDELTVELTLSSSHVHTLSEVEFTVSVMDDHGEAVTDFETIQVEQRQAGSETWRATELVQSGSVFKGTYMFMSSGDYDVRVAGMRHGHAAMESMHAMPEPLHVGRAHLVVGPYRIEFESFPGHIHEGDEAIARFWVMQAEADASGNRPAVTGLAAEIRCLDGSGVPELHSAAETTPGVYEALHTFAEAGAAQLEVRFQGQSAGFDFDVSHGH